MKTAKTFRKLVGRCKISVELLMLNAALVFLTSRKDATAARLAMA